MSQVATVFESARWIRATYAVVMGRVPDVRARSQALAQRVAQHYGPPLEVAVDDAVAPEFPRVVFASHHGNSQIHVSQIAINLQVLFTPDWQVDPSRAASYIEERATLVRGLVGLLTDAQPRFTGAGFEIRQLSARTDAEIVTEIGGRLLATPVGADVYDLEVKRVRVVEGQFFSNLVVKNFRSYTQAPPAEATPMPAANAAARGVSLTVDFNDRYAFNERPGYPSTEETAAKVLTGGLDAAREATTLFQSHP